MTGVTLMELLVVVVIIGILASIAVPSYRSYMLRAQRTDATAALLRIAAAQEKFYLQNNTYATNAQLATAPPNGLGIGATEHGYYNLSITAQSAAGFTAQAVAPSTSAQYRDTDCRTFTINETGQKTALNASATTNTATCWR
jgi:type IV pilus assembly protein PilE